MSVDNETDLASRFAESAYMMLESGNKEQRINRINESIQDTNYKVVPEHSNRNILTLRNDEENKTYVSVRGTDTSGKKTRNDIMADLNFALGEASHDAEFRKRRRTIQKAVDNAGDDYVVLTSHSLGSALVNHTLSKSNKVRNKIIENGEVHTFNSASNPFFEEQTKVGKKSQKLLKDKVTHHRTTNDLVSKGFENKVPFGSVKNYETKTSRLTKKVPKNLANVFNTADALNAHKLYHFRK